MSQTDAAVALRRFGLGSRPGDTQRIASDPRGFVLAQLGNPRAAELHGSGLEPSHVIFAEVREAQLRQRLARAMVKADEARLARSAEPGEPMAGTGTGAAPAMSGLGALRREVYRDEAVARFQHGVATDTPLLERLVLFWSNHFAVSITKGPVRPLAGAFEREAIRPHVLGRFADMLQAVERHPAMLIYLDNQLSIGPASVAGRNRTRGLNENLAREILELHTLGVDGGYTQADVTNLARLLTGWTVGGLGQPWIEPGRFLFTPNRHEPGRWPILGRSYGGRGELSGSEALDDLAVHPATARHVARKLARHFVGDKASPGLVTALETAFSNSRGDLAHVTATLLRHEESWTAPPAKIVPPYDFTVSLARSLGVATAPGEMLRLAAALGQPLWSPPSPKGWPDADDSWLGPSGIRERFRIAEKVSREFDKRLDPRAVADDILGPGAHAATRQAIARAETRAQGFELLIMSPDFMRR